MPTRNQPRARALLAMSLAGGILNAQLPALSKVPKTESNTSVIQQLVTSTALSPDRRANYLLHLAETYIRGDDMVVASLSSVASTGDTPYFSNRRTIETALEQWANKAAIDAKSTTQKTNVSATITDTPSIAAERSELALSALQSALAQLDNASDEFDKLTMYFIASCIFEKLGNYDGVARCNGVLEPALQSCESSSAPPEQLAKAASLILNARAYAIIPVTVSDSPRDIFGLREPPMKPFTEQQFEEASRLRLRAIAMVDHLPKESHVRRKAHRDLTLWYMRFDKIDEAEKEKQILFELVGSKSDSLLYPQSGGCGSLIWWKVEKTDSGFDCGMG